MKVLLFLIMKCNTLKKTKPKGIVARHCLFQDKSKVLFLRYNNFKTKYNGVKITFKFQLLIKNWFTWNINKLFAITDNDKWELRESIWRNFPSFTYNFRTTFQNKKKPYNFYALRGIYYYKRKAKRCDMRCREMKKVFGRVIKNPPKLKSFPFLYCWGIQHRSLAFKKRQNRQWKCLKLLKKLEFR